MSSLNPSFFISIAQKDALFIENSMNAEEELSKILSEQIAREIDAEILKNIMAMAANQVRKKSIGKIFKVKDAV